MPNDVPSTSDILKILLGVDSAPTKLPNGAIDLGDGIIAVPLLRKEESAQSSPSVLASVIVNGILDRLAKADTVAEREPAINPEPIAAKGPTLAEIATAVNNKTSNSGKTTPPFGVILSNIEASQAKKQKSIALPNEVKPFETDDNGPVLRYHGLNVVHIQSNDEPHMGMTVAYRKPSGYNGDHPSTVEISTAICHPADRFAKKAGTRKAIMNFLEGKTVGIPVILGMTPASSIKSYFSSFIERN